MVCILFISSKWCVIKDSAYMYFCYWAYVLCISRYLGFLWVVAKNNTGIFLRGLKLGGESRT